MVSVLILGVGIDKVVANKTDTTHGFERLMYGKGLCVHRDLCKDCGPAVSSNSHGHFNIAALTQQM